MHPGAWRLSAEELERRVADLVRAQVSKPELRSFACARCISRKHCTAISASLSNFTTGCDARDLLALVRRVDIEPGSITLEIAATALAKNLEIDPDIIEANRLTVHSSVPAPEAGCRNPHHPRRCSNRSGLTH